MTPAETTTILRNFNKWRRGNENIPQLDAREIGKAIDAAVEMIERLEEAESECLEQARLNGIGSERDGPGGGAGPGGPGNPGTPGGPTGPGFGVVVLVNKGKTCRRRVTMY